MSAEAVRSTIARIEELQGQIDDFNADKADIYKEAKGAGLDVRALKEVVRIRRNGETKWEKSQEVVGLYLEHLTDASNSDTRAPHAREAAAPPVSPAPKTNGSYWPRTVRQ